MKKNERTLKAIRLFKELHDEGKSVPEIAKICEISPSTLYKHLDEIAAQLHTSRYQLLECPGAGNPYGSAGRYATKLPKVDTAHLSQRIAASLALCTEMRKSIGLQLSKANG